MPDQLHDDDLQLAIAGGRAEFSAAVLAETLSDRTLDGPEKVVAAAALFMSVCRAADIDPEATLAQTVEAIERAENRGPARLCQVVTLN